MEKCKMLFILVLIVMGFSCQREAEIQKSQTITAAELKQMAREAGIDPADVEVDPQLNQPIDDESRAALQKQVESLVDKYRIMKPDKMFMEAFVGIIDKMSAQEMTKEQWESRRAFHAERRAISGERSIDNLPPYAVRVYEEWYQLIPKYADIFEGVVTKQDMERLTEALAEVRRVYGAQPQK